MRWWWKNNGKRLKQELGEKVDEVILSAELPDGIETELNTEEIPTLDLKLETKTVDVEEKKIKTAVKYEQPVYEPPTDKEIIEGLDFCGNYEAACRLTELKKENAVLKGKLTRLRKKCLGYKHDLDRAKIAMEKLIKEGYDDSRKSR